MFGKNKKQQEQFKKVESKDEEEVVDKNPMEEIAKETEQKVKETIVVVKELPMQPVRQAKAEDGTLITYITIEEALTKFVNEEEE